MGDVPKGWEITPNMGRIVDGTMFLPMKTPVKESLFRTANACNWTVDTMMKEANKSLHPNKLGSMIDLTSSQKYYSHTEVAHRMGYKKIHCTPNVPPTKEHVREFCAFVADQLKSKPEQIIAVHCTHGYNVTGFLIVAYLCEVKRLAIEAALKAFARARQPGICNPSFIQELFIRYGGGRAPATYPYPSPPPGVEEDSLPAGREGGNAGEGRPVPTQLSAASDASVNIADRLKAAFAVSTPTHQQPTTATFPPPTSSSAGGSAAQGLSTKDQLQNLMRRNSNPNVVQTQPEQRAPPPQPIPQPTAQAPEQKAPAPRTPTAGGRFGTTGPVDFGDLNKDDPRRVATFVVRALRAYSDDKANAESDRNRASTIAEALHKLSNNPICSKGDLIQGVKAGQEVYKELPNSRPVMGQQPVTPTTPSVQQTQAHAASQSLPTSTSGTALSQAAGTTARTIESHGDATEPQLHCPISAMDLPLPSERLIKEAMRLVAQHGAREGWNPLSQYGFEARA